MNELKGFLFEGKNETPVIIIYASDLTPRLKYVCKFIFNQGLLCNYILTGDENEFMVSPLARINYSAKSFDKALNIIPNGLLESGVIRGTITDKENKGFEPFSFVFYHIARMEEWREDRKDEHARTFFTESDEPEVDQVIQDLKKKLVSLFPKMTFGQRSFKYISTIDVDNVFAYKAKPFYRQIGGALKDLKNIGPRLGTIFFGKKDPFDKYDFQVEVSKKYKIPLIYFFLYRNGTQYDRTIDPNHPEFIKLLKYLKDNSIQFGLHPSYDSSIDTSLLKSELALLKKNTSKEIICSRQHFLRFNIRTTPKQLIEAGIKFDFTMGMANWYGYRAATTLPFYYYDTASETELDLMAVPFAVMDGNYYGVDPEKDADINTTKNLILGMAHKAREVNGLFITVTHDRSFSDLIAPGWKDLYIQIHETLKN